MTLNRVMAVSLHCFISLNLVNMRSNTYPRRSVAEFMYKSIVFCSTWTMSSSRSLSHLISWWVSCYY